MTTRSSCPVWLWALLPLLLAAALAIPLLDIEIYNGDEPHSLIAAGALHSGPNTLAEVWSKTARRHSPGWPMLLFVWGRSVGWQELAIRTLALLVGLLTIAWVYRAGRDLFAPAAGAFAALLLGASLFHLTYMARAGPYALVALSAALCLWSYWRVARHPRPPGRGAQVALLLGATGLCYSNWFAALMLPTLGLYHLLFVPKTRRWWRPVILLGLAALIASLQIPLLLRGLMYTEGEGVAAQVLSAPGVLSYLVRFLGNGLVDLPTPLDSLLLILLLAALLLVLLRLRAGKAGGAIWLPAFVAATLTALLLAINEVMRVIVDNRIRYFMPLWPMMALLAGAGLWRLARRHSRLVTVLLAFWLVFGAWLTLATDFRYELAWFRDRSNEPLVWRAVRKRIPEGDLVVMDNSSKSWHPFQLLYLPYRTIISQMDERLADLMPLHAAEPAIWLLYDSSLSQAERSFIERDGRLERILCERVQHPVLDERELRLERYVRHPSEACPDNPVRLEFDGGIRLIGPRTKVRDGLLRLDANFHSADDALLANYSLAVHVIDPRTGQRVAQGDVGVGPGSFVPVTSEIDISALPAGEYELRVGLYNWQTGERLPGRDLETGASGDIHALQRFRLD